MNDVRLGVNIDHVATLRRLRDTTYPDIIIAANECIQGGADQITVHLREDRRHIVDEDVKRLKNTIKVDLNLEMAATTSMLDFALELKPTSICIVPEKREERTTEGGLDLNSREKNKFLEQICRAASDLGIHVGFFIEPRIDDVKKSIDLGVSAVELHTGSLCILHQSGETSKFTESFNELKSVAKFGSSQSIRVHAGHGIDYNIAAKLSKIKDISEYNIGHAIVCESVFHGLKEATSRMKNALTRR